MKVYRKFQLGYAIKDYFKECRGIIAVAFLISCIGFSIGMASVIDVTLDEIILINAGKVCLRIIATISVCYFLIFISNYNKYCVFFGISSFFIAGYRVGICISLLTFSANVGKISSLILIYIPAYCISFLLMTIAQSYCLGYNGNSPLGYFANNCISIQRKLFRVVCCILIINIIILTLFILIFGNLFNVVYVVI